MAQKQQYNFHSYTVTHNSQNVELMDPPCHRMPIRGEKYEFTCIPPENCQNNMDMQEYLNQFDAVTDQIRASIQVLEHTDQFSPRDIEAANQILEEINTMADKCEDADTDDDPANLQSSLCHPPITRYCEKNLIIKDLCFCYVMDALHISTIIFSICVIIMVLY